MTNTQRPTIKIEEAPASREQRLRNRIKRMARLLNEEIDSSEDRETKLIELETMLSALGF